MSNDLIKLLPSEQELAQLSKNLKRTVTSRNELLSQIGALKIEELSFNEKMVYVMGLIGLGFDEMRARKRLGISNSHFYIWKQDEDNNAMFESAVARGEMVLEEKVLVEAESNPEMAFKLLKEKQRKQERTEDMGKEKDRNILDIMNESARERGLIQEGEIVDETLQ
jgi:hypothetical protein